MIEFNNISITLDQLWLKIIQDIFLAWWYILPPLILLPLVPKAWLWWRQEKWESKQQYIVLEITPPPVVEKPFKAMEQVMANFWSIYSSLGLVKIISKWVKGRKMYYLSLEIACIQNQTRMYIRILKTHRDTIESAIYSQFPDAEIKEVYDYTESVPFQTPFGNWDLYGFDEMLTKPDVYPIKTYASFFEEKADQNREEKRIDPINALFEGLSKLKNNEQIWLQFRIEPATNNDNNYLDRGKKLIDRLTYRTAKKKSTEAESFLPPEMKLTSKEKENVNAIENKISKQIFQTNIRCIYFAEKSDYERGRRTLAEQYFSGFSTQDLNSMKKWKKTKTRIYNFFTVRRLFVRQRNMIRRFVMRETPLFPKRNGIKIFNTEELATMFHFPINSSYFMNTMGSSSKKGGAPADLPMDNTNL